MPQLDLPAYSSTLTWVFVMFWVGYYFYRFGALSLVWTKLRLMTRDNTQQFMAAPLLAVVGLNSPLDQFLILVVAFGHKFGITNFTIGYLFALLVLNFAWIASAKKWVELVMRTTVFPAVRTLSTGGIAPVKGYDQVYSYVFLTILAGNLLGMIPYALTITSFSAFTFYLSFTMFLGLNIIAFAVHHWTYAGMFLPSGSPMVMAPFIIVIELISYLARPLSLGIRRFANMLAGHALVKILAGFAWSMLTVGIVSVFALVPWAAVFAVTGLECVIAVLQAYVFITLCSIYMQDVIKLH